MSEEDNQKSFNKKHLKKQIEAKKKAKRGIDNDDESESEEIDETNNLEDSNNEDKDDKEEKEEELKSESKSNKSQLPQVNTSITSPFANSNSNSNQFGSPFSPFAQSSSTNNFNFVNNESTFAQEMEKEIHIYKVLNKKRANHYNAVIQGLSYLGKDKIKELLSKIKKKFGVGGFYKIIEDIDDKEECLFFSGNYAEKIMDFLIKELDRDESYFILHK